jgi:hypothetical protein
VTAPPNWGFVGQKEILEPSRKGHRVRALAATSAAHRIMASGGKAVRGELTSIDALTSGINGCEWVVRCFVDRSLPPD